MTFKPFIPQARTVDGASASSGLEVIRTAPPKQPAFISALNNLREKRFPRPQFPNAMPEVLWHYTGSDAACSILREGTLRLTNIRFLNDSSEYNIALAAIRRNVEKPSGAVLPEETKYLFPQILKHLESLADSAVYVASFSGARDLLSQWSGYGPTGYALGFDSMELDELVFQADQLALHPCLYSETEHNVSVNAALADVRSAFAAFRELGHPVARAGNAAAVFSEALLGQLVGFLKHEKYLEEQEWRIVTMPSYLEQPAPLKLVSRGRAFVPYSEFAFRSAAVRDDKQWPLLGVEHPLKEVMIAPPSGEDAEGLIPTGLSQALLRYGYHDVLISGSEIPHRAF